MNTPRIRVVSREYPRAHLPDLTTCLPGLFHCPLPDAQLLMPEFAPILRMAPVETSSWVVDVKIHMLMPGQWPCIPNWHFDFVPRDEQGRKQFDQRDRRHRMYAWVSGPPLTVFRDDEGNLDAIPERRWVEFDQFDEHQGQSSAQHCWRAFIRIVPEELCPAAKPDQWVRRHTQVYLDANQFEW